MVYYLNRLASIAGQEASIIAGSGILSVPATESEKQLREQQRTGVSPATGRRTAPLPPLGQIPSFEGVRSQLVPQSGTSRAREVLENVERNKLMGIGANQ